MDDLHERAVQLWLEKASDYTRLNESIGAVVDLVLEEAARRANEEDDVVLSVEAIRSMKGGSDV